MGEHGGIEPLQASEPRRKPAARRLRRAWTCGVALATLAIAALAAHRLRSFPYPLDVGAALRGVREVAPATVPAALKVWLIVGTVVTGVAAWLRRCERELAVGEAMAGAVALLWGGAYLALLALGPTGLYRAVTLRALLGAILLATWRRSTPGDLRARTPPGTPILLLAIGLSLGPLLLLQLASPVSPFMDVLPYIAPAQKIVTFRFYDAFNNDAAGLWASTRQVIGGDALFSALALVADVPAHLAITALIVPFAMFQLFALALLGRTVHGSLAGALGSLFLLQTFVWRRTPDMRTTTLAFALVASGLALLLARAGGRLRVPLAGLTLGVAVAVSPLIGAAGMQVAACALVLRWIDLGGPLVRPLLALAAGSLFAVPQVAVGLGVALPWWSLAAAATLGASALLALAQRRAPSWPRPRACALARVATIVSLPAVVLLVHARRQSEFVNDTWFGYGLLTLLGVAGLAVTGRDAWTRPRAHANAALIAVALWVGLVDHGLASPLRFGGALETRSVAGEVTTKMMYYWAPYWLALAAGVLVAMLVRRWSRLAIVLALLLVVYPVRHVPEPLDYDGQQLSLAETWGFHLANAARGYHAGRPDRRWVLDAEWRAVAELLQAEIAAGRITYSTHILQISAALDSAEIALWTGISVDVISRHYDPQSVWTGNGRARGLDAVASAFAVGPRYVLLSQFPSSRFPQLAAYEELFSGPSLRLYRLPGRALRDAQPSAAALSDAMT